MAEKPNGSSAAKPEMAKMATAKVKPMVSRGRVGGKAAAPGQDMKAAAQAGTALSTSVTPTVPAAPDAVAKAEPAPQPVAPLQALSQEPPAASQDNAETAALAPAETAAEQPAPQPSIQELKEKIMATQPTANAEQITQSVTAALGDMQERAKSAYEKGTASMTEMTEFAKGNVEAVMESGKILASSMQDMGKVAVEEAKTAYETATADMKEMAAIKSPTELFQLQGKIARRNFDAMVAASSRNTEMMMKLASEVFAPISGRVNVATEKLSRTAA